MVIQRMVDRPTASSDTSRLVQGEMTASPRPVPNNSNTSDKAVAPTAPAMTAPQATAPGSLGAG